MQRLAVVGILAMLLAGCVGSNPTSTTKSVTGGVPAEAAVGLQVPAWHLRDAWTYSIGDAKATYVVTADQGNDWFVDTDSPERSFQNLRDDVSRLGPQRKSDLAGSQGDDRVKFFEWPLTEGKAWTTQWDHKAVAIVAHLEGGVAKLEAKDQNGTLVYRYTYDAAVGWFRDLHHFAADGSELIGLTLTEAKHNWTGQIARWDLQTITRSAGDLATGQTGSASYDVPLTATDVWVDAAVACSTGAVSAGTSPLPVVTSIAGVDPRGGGAAGSPCPATSGFTGPVGAPKAPPQGGTSETWGWSVIAPPGSVGTYRFEILVRTLHLVPVGP